MPKRSDLRSRLYCVTAIISLSLAAQGQGACTLSRGTGKGGTTCLALENEFLKMALVPESGGACQSLIYKRTGKELVLPGREFEAMLFKEFVRGYLHEWAGKEYDYRVLEQTPARIAAQLWRRGESGALRWTTFTKTIIIEAGKSLVQIDYHFSNQVDSMIPIRVPLRFHHAAATQGEPATYYVPREPGVQEKVYTPDEGSDEIWAYDATAGWLAAIGSQSHTGFAFDIGRGYQYLMCLYCWLGADRFATAEWMFRTLEVEPGKSLSYTTYLIPFSGLKGVAGVGGGIVADIRLPKGTCALADAAKGFPVELELYSAAERATVVSVQACRIGGAAQELARQTVALAPDEVRRIACVFKAAEAGTYVVRGEVRSKEDVLCRFEKPLVVGNPSGAYKLRPVAERLGDDEERFVKARPLLTKPSGKDYLTWTDASPTPHIKWAKPYARGKIKALILTDYLLGREIIELAQRLDVDFDTYTTLSQSGGRWESWWGYGGGEAGRAAKLKHYLKSNRYDVVVFGGLHGGQFNAEHRKLLLDHMRKGTGLVYVQPTGLDPELWGIMPFAGEPLSKLHYPQWGRSRGAWQKAKEHFITTGIPFASLPKTMFHEYEAQGEVLATVAGNPLVAVTDPADSGRTVALSYISSCYPPHRCGLTPWVRYPPQKFHYWEYYYSLLAKSVVWAAKKEPAVTVRGLGLISVPQGGQEGSLGFELRLDNRGPELQAQAEASIRDAYSRQEAQETVAITIANGSAEVRVPIGCNLHGGPHLLDVVIKARGEVVNWGSVAFDVPSPVSVKSMTIPEGVYGKGGTVRVELSMVGEGHVDLRMGLVDQHGRKFETLSKAIDLSKQKETTFSVALAEPVTTVAYARLTVLRGGQALWYEEEDFLMMPETFAKRAWDDYELLTDWGSLSAHNEHILPLRAKAMQDLGFRIMLESSSRNAWYSVRNQHEAALRCGFQVGLVSFYDTGLRRDAYKENKKLYGKTGDKQYLVRKPSLEDPAFLEKQKQHMRSIGETYRKFCPFAYCYGDEISLTCYTDAFDYDWSPHALAAFRTWLNQDYGDLGRLNKQWGTGFDSWEAVLPMTSDEAQKHGNYAPWADHREFMDLSNARFYAAMREAIRSVDPLARCGLSGTQRPRAHTGSDYSRLMHVFDFLQTYGGDGFREIQDSFSNAKTAPWLGYGAKRAYLSDQIWQCLLHGGSGMSFFTPRNMLNPDLTPRHDAKAVVEITAPIRNGLGKLLVNAKLDRRVAIHYSQPSVRAAFLMGKTEQFDLNRGGWVALTHDLGHQVAFLSSVELRRGELANHDALILPLSMALSQEEAEAIRAFVHNGGLVIADGRTGIWDEHCTARSGGALDGLFGIERGSASPKQKGGTISFHGSFRDCDLDGKSVYGAVANLNVRATSGKALGGLSSAPVAVVSKHGKGHAVYLNMLMSSYESAMTRGGERPMHEVMQEVFSLGGPRSPATIASGGKRVPQCEVAKFVRGDLEYIGILQRGLNPKLEPGKATIKLYRKAHVYDTIRGAHVGLTDRVETTLVPTEGQVFALLPYRVERVEVRASSAFEAGERIAGDIRIVPTEGSRLGTHVVRLEVYGPKGKARRYYGKKLVAEEGRCKFAFPSALSDAAGKWRIQATDAATGVSGATNLILR